MNAKLWLSALVAYFLFFGALLFLVAHFRDAEATGPAQPIAFSHPVHIDTVGLECNHCHRTADRSRHAGIPTVEICMECHASAATDRAEIQKLTRYWEEEREIVWERVHAVPWHVYFAHKPHIRAAVECRTCHGDVEYQPRIRQVRSLKMGWCVACHRDREAPTDCWVCHK